MEQRILAGLEPQRVFHFFEDLCRIPHGSGNTKAISDYCVAFAKERGLRYAQDSSNNVIIWQNGTAGYEDHPAVILQGHLDMVCGKDPDVDFDFTKDALRLEVKDGCVNAQGTTLGGDDGIAVAFALAVMDDPSIPHPPLEAVFTVDEEIGLLGAAALDCSALNARAMINIDSESEGILTVACAGGVRCDTVLPLAPGHGCGVYCTFTLSGFSGGHSGSDIHRGRANTNKLLGEALELLTSKYALQLQSLEGGKQDNAIPAYSRCTFLLPADQTAPAKESLNIWWAEVKTRYAQADPDCAMSYTDGAEVCGTAYSIEDSRVIAQFITATPNGVQAMSKDMPGLVESSCNLGILALAEDGFHMTTSLRSSVNADKERMRETLSSLAQRYGATFSCRGEYPAWEYRKDSPLRETMVAAYRSCYDGKEPVVEAIHAGLECGLFSNKIPHLDCVSFGPDIHEIHTPRERLPIDSVQRTWNYLLTVLKAL